MGDDARHARAIDVPAVALARVYDAEIFRIEAVKAQRVGALITFIGLQIDVDADRLTAKTEFKNIRSHTAQADAIGKLYRCVAKISGVEEIVGRAYAAKGEAQFQAHHLIGLFARRARLHHLLFRHQAVVATVDVTHLRIDLLLRAYQYRFASGVVGMLGNDQALLVEHLQDGELGQIGELAVLQRMVRQQDNVGPCLTSDTANLGRHNQPALSQMLDRVCRAATQDAQTGIGDFYPVDTGRDYGLVNCLHGPAKGKLGWLFCYETLL